ncbi:MAG TPA: universal stress protein [Devosia sp.]|nr:universal stress protein [Devosia sp.]
MELRTILVDMDVDGYSAELLQVAIDLASRFDARIAAVAAASLQFTSVSPEALMVEAELYESRRNELEDRLASLEADFHRAVPERLRGNCVTLLDTPTSVVARAARKADLILTQTTVRGAAHSLDVGDVLLTTGRPVLIVGNGNALIKSQAILVAWKESREARRAVVDALPLLKRASSVALVTIHEGGDRFAERDALNDAEAWLKSHDVKVESAIHAPRGSYSETLSVLARDAGAGLVVAGAYGHGRLREWILGGATQELLAASALNRFMSN